ncbi:MAG: IS630 transposase-related protein [Blastocatellia bacterium]
MAAYSLDLRERIITAVERGDQTKRAVAALFEVHESFIYKLLRQQREAGHLAPLPHGGGQSAKLQDEQLAVLAALVAQTPDATLDELATQLHQRSGVKGDAQPCGGA